MLYNWVLIYSKYIDEELSKQVCPGSREKCPNSSTCCKNANESGYGCCPYKNAQCCSDGEYLNK